MGMIGVPADSIHLDSANYVVGHLPSSASDVWAHLERMRRQHAQSISRSFHLAGRRYEQPVIMSIDCQPIVFVCYRKSHAPQPLAFIIFKSTGNCHFTGTI